MATTPIPDPPIDLPPAPYPAENPGEPTIFPDPVPNPEPVSPTMPVFDNYQTANR